MDIPSEGSFVIIKPMCNQYQWVADNIRAYMVDIIIFDFASGGYTIGLHNVRMRKGIMQL